MKGPPRPAHRPPPTTPSSSVRREAGSLPPAVIYLLLLGLALAVYFPALNGQFLWDDSGHVTRADLRPLAGLGRIWFEFGATQQYYPVLHSAFWLEHLLWGDATLPYHLANVALHTGVALLFGLTLRRLALPQAWLAAALFLLHPVCVESVAWISEQKNTLSAVFYLGAALAYLRFDRDRRPAAYAGATALFLLALLTKTVTASLPAALLVVFWWQRGRLDWRRDVLPLLPWFLAGAAMGLVTAHFERALIGAEGADFSLGFPTRALLAGRIVWFYLGKLLWPAPLIFVYPRWTPETSAGGPWLHLAAALLVLGFLVFVARRWCRGPLAAALLFAGTLFPVLGFLNVFPFVFSFVADHFQYLASLGVFALAAAGAAEAARRFPGATRGGAALVLLTLGLLSWRQSRIYRDPTTLYEATLRENPEAWLAHHNLAIILANSGHPEAALPHAEAVRRLRPNYAPGENNLGDDLLRLERAAEAVPHFRRALELQPNYAVAQCNLGVALAMLGRNDEAIPHFQEAVRLNPAYGEAELNWGLALMLTRRFPEAVPHFEQAIRLEPASAYFQLTYGRALANANQPGEAIPHLEIAIRLEPRSAEAEAELAAALTRLGRKTEASVHEQRARTLSGAGR
jgi:tetratricopeptide (TPR) repeat protein